MKIVYVAGPFRGKNAWVVENNIRRAEALALEVWKLGAACICPHTNTRFFDGAAPDNVFLDGDLAIVLKCSAVLMTPDWGYSRGATAEHDYAKLWRIPIFYELAELAKWLQVEFRPSRAVPE